MTRGYPRGSRTPARDEEMARLYLEEGMTYEEIGAIHGVTRERVRQVLKRRGADEPSVAGAIRRGRKDEKAQAALAAFDDLVGPAIRRLLMIEVHASEIAQRLSILGQAITEDDVRSFAARQNLIVPYPAAPRFPTAILTLAVQAAAVDTAGLSVSPADASIIEAEYLEALLAVSTGVQEVTDLAARAGTFRQSAEPPKLTKAEYESWRGGWLSRYPKDDPTPWPPTAQTIMKRLGRGFWSDAVVYAGLEANTQGRTRGALVYKDQDEHLSAVAAFLTYAGRKGLPMSLDEYERWASSRPVPSGGQLRNRFGGWNSAKLAAVALSGGPAIRPRGARILPADLLVDRFVSQAEHLVADAEADAPIDGHRAVRDMKLKEVTAELAGDLISAFESFRRRWIYDVIREDPSAFVAKLGPDGGASRSEKREWQALGDIDAREAVETVINARSLDAMLSETTGDLRNAEGWLAANQQARLDLIDSYAGARWRVFKAVRNVLEHDVIDSAERLARPFAEIATIDPSLAVGSAPTGPVSVRRWLAAEAGLGRAHDHPVRRARVARLFDLVVEAAAAMRSIPRSTEN